MYRSIYCGEATLAYRLEASVLADVAFSNEGSHVGFVDLRLGFELAMVRTGAA